MNHKKITLDTERKSFESIIAMQGDNKSRYIDATIVNRSIPVDLTGCAVKFSAIKPDITDIFNDAVIIDAKGGKVQIELTNQTLAKAGVIQATLVILKEDMQLSVLPFFITVIENPYNPNAIESKAEYQALNNALIVADGYAKELQDASVNLEEKYTARLNNFGSQLDTTMNKADTNFKLNQHKGIAKSFESGIWYKVAKLNTTSLNDWLGIVEYSFYAYSSGKVQYSKLRIDYLNGGENSRVLKVIDNNTQTINDFIFTKARLTKNEGITYLELLCNETISNLIFSNKLDILGNLNDISNPTVGELQEIQKALSSNTVVKEIDIKLIVNNYNLKPLIVKKENKKIIVGRKYDKTTDLRTVINNDNVNGTPQLRSFHKFTNILQFPSDDFSNIGDNFQANQSDYIGPIICKAVNNIDGDLPDELDFCGGMHNYNDTIDGNTNTANATARNISYSVFVDGYCINDYLDYKSYAENVKIIIKNRIQASNTKKSTGGGREVVEETVTYEFKSNGDLNVEVVLLPLEDITVHKYYGFQANLNNFYANGSKIYFWKDNYTTTANDFYWSGRVSGGKEHICYKTEVIKGDDKFIMELKPINLGSRFWLEANEAQVFSTEWGKVYYNLIRPSNENTGITFKTGASVSWSGVYKVEKII